MQTRPSSLLVGQIWSWSAKGDQKVANLTKYLFFWFFYLPILFAPYGQIWPSLPPIRLSSAIAALSYDISRCCIEHQWMMLLCCSVRWRRCWSRLRMRRRHRLWGWVMPASRRHSRQNYQPLSVVSSISFIVSTCYYLYYTRLMAFFSRQPG